MIYKEDVNNNRIYPIEDSCIFKKNNGEFGGLSNMASVFPLELNGIKIKSTEALYQACKFPHDTELQYKIITANSPFTTKMIAKGKVPRLDWLDIRIPVMRWCIRVKLAQNYHSFGELLIATKDKSIVEYSDRDTFWGATKINEFELRGKNALGRLLMELRQEFHRNSIEEMLLVSPPKITEFILLGKKIETIDMTKKYGC